MNKMKSVDETLAMLREHYHLTDAERQPKQLKTSDFDGPVIFSHDPKIATVPPAFFTVQTIQELKELGGVPDSEYGPGGMEPHHPLPEPYSAERLANVTGNHVDICKAFRAYIYGYSPLVKDYEDILNAKRFPMKVALYSGKDIVVAASNPLITGDENSHGEPVVLTFNKITIEPGGKIIYRTNGTVIADEAVIVNSPNPDPTPDDNDDPHLIVIGGNGSNGGKGNDGSGGRDGSNGSAGKDNKNSCAMQATNGTAGSDGTDGARGSDGGKGEDADDVYFNTRTLSGFVNMLTQGGDGGNGGNGGNGGSGGKGGNGGASTSECSAGKGGKGGNGGNGGNSGNGGNAGDGGNIYFNYQEGGSATFQSRAIGGTGGKGGTGGSGGAGGGGGTGSTGGAPGSSGSSGSTGADGKAGAIGAIYVKGKKQ
ncbi:hypothetical protein [Xenorhabdus sp. Sc-CR9]|uniref:hypothetical protein n=1 Tax=Xenorhabdus sp. Sc-CR9 TaxID=2584468 RepID=UPI001F39BB4A|nr:hypothetical protein [Xenorhabdus sp. Sc-CR9]